jgi:hypothetical protein
MEKSTHLKEGLPAGVGQNRTVGQQVHPEEQRQEQQL